jgi:hypothetical protein
MAASRLACPSPTSRRRTSTWDDAEVGADRVPVTATVR